MRKSTHCERVAERSIKCLSATRSQFVQRNEPSTRFLSMKILSAHHQEPTFTPDVFVAEIDGAKARSLRAFYTRIAKVLHFPNYFGKNLDAMFDCLCSLEAVGKQEVVLLIRNYDFFLEKEKSASLEACLKVFRDAELPENRTDGVVFRAIGLKL